MVLESQKVENRCSIAPQVWAGCRVSLIKPSEIIEQSLPCERIYLPLFYTLSHLRIFLFTLISVTYSLIIDFLISKLKHPSHIGWNDLDHHWWISVEDYINLRLQLHSPIEDIMFSPYSSVLPKEIIPFCLFWITAIELISTGDRIQVPVYRCLGDPDSKSLICVYPYVLCLPMSPFLLYTVSI